MSTEDKKKLVEKQKEWFNRQNKEKQNEMRKTQESILKIDIITI